MVQVLPQTTHAIEEESEQSYLQTLGACLNEIRRTHEHVFPKILLFAVVLCAAKSYAYSVLTHEELIDLVWTDSLRPLLMAKFPGATENQLREAHAFAYGG